MNIAVADVKIESADISSLLDVLEKNVPEIRNVQVDGSMELTFSVSARELERLEKLIEKRGERLTVLDRRGLVYEMRALLRRPVLMLGLLGILILSFWVPSRVLFVQVEGNIDLPKNQILEKAAESGISFGASRREVRSEKMKNRLLQAMPQLQWAGVNTYGCTAIITVRERNDLPAPEESCTVSSIVASRDGILGEITVLQGNALCKPGQAVRAGQMLISGYTDCGICIRAEQAKGEVFAQTNRLLTAVSPVNRRLRGEITATSEKIMLILGKKRINFFKGSGISGAGCAKIYEEKYISLPGGFQLPVGICVEKTVFYAETEEPAQPNEKLLQDFARQYLFEQMIAGKIRLAREKFSIEDGLFQLDGNYSCYEMIGAERPEESLAKHE